MADRAAISHNPVVVTGASGFLGLHLVRLLLEKGYQVRGTLRSLDRAGFLRAALRDVPCGEKQLEFVTADLERDEGWHDALSGAELVFHVASPIPERPTSDQRSLLGPAREGTLRVLRAAHEQGVRRVVLTSSISAVLSGHARDGSRCYSEKDWSLIGSETPAYDLSKTLAERAAWDFVAALPAERPLELVVLNPGFVFGPVLEPDIGTSNQVIKKLIDRELPGLPRLGFAPIDVRDLAELHYRAMITPEAAGERFCCANDHMTLPEIAEFLAANGYRVPRRSIPDWLFRVATVFDAQARVILPELGKREDIDSTKARQVLGFQPREVRETLLDTARSLIRIASR
jgi:nucleoside-diphosphate-sugar epimerase